jgi:hypothetical protein
MGGEASLPKHPASPQKKREKGRERETARGRERHMYMYIFFGAAIYKYPLVKLFLRALDKITEYPQNT